MAGVLEGRRLRVELRRAREGAELTQLDVARALDWSTSKLIRIEGGITSVTVTDLKALLDHYKIDDQARVDELVRLAKNARVQPWSQFKDIFSAEFLEFLGYEYDAATIDQFQPYIVPGLLQTEAYARAVIGRAAEALGSYDEPAATDLVDRKVDARMARQEHFLRPGGPTARFVLDEAVLRREVGGRRVLLGQIQKLERLMELPNVTIQVLPFSAGVHPYMGGPFQLLTFADAGDDDVLFVENARGDVTTRDDREAVVAYRNAFVHFQEMGMSPEDSRRYIHGLATELTDAGVSAPHDGG